VKRLRMSAKAGPVHEAGFTAFELVIVLLAAAVLWLVQLKATGLIRSRFMDALEKNIASSVQVGIVAYFVDPKRGNLKSFPERLDGEDSGKCEPERKCFDDVLPGGVTAAWKKVSSFIYQGPTGTGAQWRYEPRSGNFTALRDRGRP
jgi:hypothetical protein